MVFTTFGSWPDAVRSASDPTWAPEDFAETGGHRNERDILGRSELVWQRKLLRLVLAWLGQSDMIGCLEIPDSLLHTVV